MMPQPINHPAPPALLPESSVEVRTILHRLPCHRCMSPEGEIKGHLESDGWEETVPPLHNTKQYRVICTSCGIGAFVSKKYPYTTYEPVGTESTIMPPIGAEVAEQ